MHGSTGLSRLDPSPEFIVFPGDEIIGLVPDEASLRRQWHYWFDVEMAWLDRSTIPLFNTTGNHTAYDRMSELVFADVMRHLPRNGPPGQEGLAYFVRRGDLLLVFVHTLWSGLGGEGHVETTWLGETLARHADARWKFVVGHHPAFPVNGYAGAYQRTIGDEHVTGFWRILREHGVLAYLCSHILAFDVQCHQGVLQICSAGAGTAHRMPEETEYLHCVQIAVDDAGLRYQVIDDSGEVRERLEWPPSAVARSVPLADGEQPAPWLDHDAPAHRFRLRGVTDGGDDGNRQTIIAAHSAGGGEAPLWIGLAGVRRQLTVMLQPVPGRSPHYWLGPELGPDGPFDIELMVHPHMGPGGLLWRPAGGSDWTGLTGSSAWGAERLVWPDWCCVGRRSGAADAQPFRGRGLKVAWIE